MNYEVSENFRKQFCYLFSFVFFVLALLFFDSLEVTYIYIISSLSGFFFICGIFFYNSKLIRALAVCWLKIGQIIGFFVNPVVLFVLYFGLITPLGCVLKIIGRDYLKVRASRRKSITFWENYTASEDGGWEDQF